MISIVLVSHSRKLAEGLLDLLRQVTPPGVQIAEAAGVGPDYAEIGTDAVHIAEVIQSVFSADGVLVLMDLGSAVLSAEMALDLLPEDMRAKIRFCPAAFVEGALTAGVQAGMGADLESAYRESQQALAAKVTQLAGPDAATEPEESRSTAPAAESRAQVLTIRNPHGLHLRPAALFVQAAARFQAEVQVWNLTHPGGPAPARSINALALLNVRQGDEIRLSASGPDAEAALGALGELIRQNFGEGEGQPEAIAGRDEDAVARQTPQPATPVEVTTGVLSGVPISGGVAVAPLFRFKRASPAASADEPAGDPDSDWKRFEQALRRVKTTLAQRQAALQQRTGQDPAAAILSALSLLLDDPELIQAVRRRIDESGQSAAAAWREETRRLKERFSGLSDPYLQQRAADIDDISGQVLGELAGRTANLEIPGSGPVILFAEELSPTETAQINLERVAGLVTTGGGATSHSAILARAMGIPAVSGIHLPADLPDGALLILDGDQGQVWVAAPEAIRTQYAERQRAWSAERQSQRAGSRAPAVLKSGRRIEVLANIGSAAEARQAVAQGAEGVGLLRTEFLFLNRAEAPGEEEQLAALGEIGQIMEGRPVIVRTLDVGGDKDLPYLNLPAEANPFLGVRAIRLALRRVDLFQVQLRAILRAADAAPLRIMFPMIATLDDLNQALAQLESAHAALSLEHAPHRWPIETGIMVEIPAAALLSRRLAERVDFFSIGTNDLTQYTLAADRGSPELAEYADALHPAVLYLIRQVVEGARRSGKKVGVCGELAGDPLAAPVLVGLGVYELSLNPAGIPRIKATLRGLDEDTAARLAEQALQMDSAAQVRVALQEP